MLKQLPTVRVGDQVLVTLPKPQIWRCVYPDCGYVAVTRNPMQYAGEDHMRAVHCREDEA